MWTSNIKKWPFLFFLFFLFCLDSFPAGKKEISLPEDSSTVELRSADPIDQQKLLEDTDYTFDRVGPAPKSPWDRFWEWFWRKVGEILDSEGGSIGFRIFEYALILGAIFLMIWLILKNDVRALFYGKSASVPIDFSELQEDIHQIDFEALIAQAVSSRDYRRAVRLHFLKMLKELSDKGLIAWQIDKTNNDYSIELTDTRYRESFRELAGLYEYVWYGDFVPDEQHFSSTVTKFKSFRF